MTKESVFLPSLLRGFMAKESQVVTWDMVYKTLTDGSLRELTERFRATRAQAHDLGEREIRTLVKSVYGLYAGGLDFDADADFD